MVKNSIGVDLALRGRSAKCWLVYWNLTALFGSDPCHCRGIGCLFKHMWHHLWVEEKWKTRVWTEKKQTLGNWETLVMPHNTGVVAGHCKRLTDIMGGVSTRTTGIMAIPTGGPAGTTNFFSSRVATGVLLILATPSCITFSTFSSSSRGKGTWCTRRWDPSDGRGTFWKAMWGLGFSCRNTGRRSETFRTGHTAWAVFVRRHHVEFSETADAFVVNQFKVSHFCTAVRTVPGCASAAWRGSSPLP